MHKALGSFQQPFLNSVYDSPYNNKHKFNSMSINKDSMQTDKNYSPSQVIISNSTHVSIRWNSEEREKNNYAGFY